MWRIGKPPATASTPRSTPPPAGASGPRMPSRQVLLAAGAAGVVVLALIHRRKATGSSNGASTDGGNPSTPPVFRNAQGTYDSSGQDTANALLDMNTRLAGIGNTLDALDPAKWAAVAGSAAAGAGTGPSGVPAPGGTDPVPGSGVAAATPPPSTPTAPAQLPWHKAAPLAPTPVARPLTGAAPKPTPAPSTRALSTFDAASRAKLAAGKAVVGGDGRTMKLVGGVPTTISYTPVAPKPPPPAPKAAAAPPRRKA